MKIEGRADMNLAMINKGQPVIPFRAGDVQFGRNGLVYENRNTDVELTVGGRLHLDVVDFDSAVTPFADDTRVRRARIYGSAKYGDWKLKVDRDIGGTSRGWKNVWLRYSGWGKFRTPPVIRFHPSVLRMSAAQIILLSWSELCPMQ